MEDARLNRARRRELIQNYRFDKSGGQPRRIQPLDTFFSLPYQGKNAFYAQTRGVIDFLMEHTRDSTVLGTIAALGGGAKFSEWLQANGARYGLPVTMDGLEKKWQAWLARLAATGLGYPP